MAQCSTISASYALNSMSQFLSTLEGRERVVGHALTWKLDFPRPLIRIGRKTPLQSHQAALRVPEPILTAKMFKKSKLSKHFCFT